MCKVCNKDVTPERKPQTNWKGETVYMLTCPECETNDIESEFNTWDENRVNGYRKIYQKKLGERNGEINDKNDRGEKIW